MAKTKAIDAKHKQSADTATPARAARKALARKPINVAGLFKTVAPKTRSSGVSKEMQKPASKANEHPIYKEGMAATDTYRKAAKAGNDDGIEGVYQELVNRVRRVDIHGRPIKVQDLPTDAELQALVDEERRITRPLAEDVLAIQTRRSDGTIATKDVTLGETMRKFDDFTVSTSTELKAMLKELEEVDTSIGELLYEMQFGMALHEAEADFCRVIVRFSEALVESREATTEDIKRAMKEDEDAGKQRKAKWERFLAEMGA